MSQEGVLKLGTGGNPTIEYLSGNTGGPVGPDASHNINVIGNNTSGINIVGMPLTNTLTVTSIKSTTTQQGAITLATNAQAIAGSDTNNAITSAALSAKLGTQTAHSLAVFEGTSSALTALGVASNGQIPIGSNGADPVLANITSSGGTITVTNGAGTINIDVASSSHVLETLTGNSGGAISPTAGNINTVGSGSITIVGSGSTLTTELTGLTNHAVLVGAGSDTITKIAATANTGAVLQNNSGADPSYSTATYPSTTTINQILYSNAANTVTGLSTANTSALTTDGSGVPGFTSYVSTSNSFGGTSNIMARDSNGNTSANVFAPGLTTYNVAADQTLTVASSENQVYSFLASGHTINLPDATTLVLGWQYQLNNNSGGTLTVKDAGGSTLTTMPPGSFLFFILLGNSFPAGSWDHHFGLPDGTGNQVLITNTVGDPVYLAPTNSAVLTSSSSGAPQWTALTDGQVVIGSSAGAPTAATLTAGTGISISNGHNSITISATGTTTLTYTAVNHAASPYTVLSTDDFIGVNATAGVVSILLPNAPATGRVLIIKDSNGQAATNNITVTTVGGAVTIDGSTSYVMKTNYQSIQVIFNGTSYEVF